MTHIHGSAQDMSTTSNDQKGLKMIKAHRLASLLHLLGAGRRVGLDASKGLVRAHLLTSKGVVRPTNCYAPLVRALASCAVGALCVLACTTSSALAAVPTIGSESVSNIKSSEATLEGTVNPNGQLTECHFQYGQSLIGVEENTVPCTPELLSGFSEQDVSPTKTEVVVKEGKPEIVVVPAPITGLAQGAEYKYQIVTKNGKGEVGTGPEQHFQTFENPNLEPATEVAKTAWELHGVLDPNNARSEEIGTYAFVYRQSAGECQYLLSAAEEHQLEAENRTTELEADRAKQAENKYTTSTGASGAQGQAVHAEVSGLLPGAPYTACLLVRNGATNQVAISSPETFTTVPAAPTVSESVTNPQETEITLNAQIDPNGAATTYHFEYDTREYKEGEGPHGTSLPIPDGEIATGIAAVPVNATATGLAPHTTYHYRVVATNECEAGKPQCVTDGPDKTFTTNAPPTTPTEPCPNAQLRAEQPYGLTLPDCRAYEMVSPLEKDDNSVSETDARASAPNAGEEPAITYLSAGSFAQSQATGREDRYLARRTSTGWSTQNISPPHQPFATEPTNPFEELLFTPELSAGLLYSENTPLPLNSGSPAGYPYLYRADTATGSYQLVDTVNGPELAPYRESDQGRLFADGASTDLSHVFFGEQAPLTPGAPAAPTANVYEWAQGSDELHLVDVPPEGKSFEIYNPGGGGEVGAPGLQQGGSFLEQDVWHAVSADGSRAFFTASEYKGLGSPSSWGVGQLYVRENPTAPPADGSDCAVPGDACTIEVSASQKTNGSDPHGTNHLGGPRNARYWGANAEGSKVFFTSDVELTNEAYTGPEDNAPNLYQYEVSNVPGQPGRLTDLSVDTDHAKDPDGAAVLGLVTASEDGEYVYFVAEGDLAAGATSGQPNLYVSHGGGEPVFIATLAPATKRGEAGEEFGGDSSDWFGGKPEIEEPGRGGLAAAAEDVGPGSHTVRVTADGTALAFQSVQSLTGYDAEQAKPGECEENLGESGAKESGKCGQVYVYHAGSGGAGSLTCASCDPSGARPIGPARLGPESQSLPEVRRSPLYEPRNLSADGDRLFFESPDPLVPHDSDGAGGCPREGVEETPSCQDVYEWELPATPSEAEKGENSCAPASPDFSDTDGGCVLPISDVAGDNASFFLDASPKGDDVFIATADQLVPSDTDQKLDVYDVRVGGGFPVTPAPPVCANADSCKPPETPQPTVFGAPASATFAGPANPPPPPPAVVKPAVKPKTKTVKCAKGKKRNKHNQCVKIKTKKKKNKAKKSAHTNRRPSR
jgi:hypothetical protein